MSKQLTTTDGVAEILCKVWKREQALDAEFHRCFIALALPKRSNLTPDQQSVLDDIVHKRIPVESRFLWRWRLGGIPEMFDLYDQAREEVRRTEARRLGVPLYRPRLFDVTLKCLCAAAHAVQPLRIPEDFLWPESLGMFYEYVQTGKKDALKWNAIDIVEVVDELEQGNFVLELLGALWVACPEEAKAMKLPRPPRRKQRAKLPDLPTLSHNAAVAYEILMGLPVHAGMTGPKLLDALQDKKVYIEQSTLTSRIIPELMPYGVENKPRKGYRIPESRRPQKNS